MKILIIQLARLGDIYTSWPVIRAIKRENPKAEIHVLVRKKFEKALVGLESLDHIHVMETSEILSPLASHHPDLDAALKKVSQFVQELKNNQFDVIVNLTFSPFSSYLTHALEGAGDQKTQVLGYSRHSDGTLRLSDEVSKYFFSQVGIDRFNRVHLADIFSSLVGIPYMENDWMQPQIPDKDISLSSRYVVVHIGASENHKTLNAQQWIVFIQSFLEFLVEKSVGVVLVGAPSEVSLAKVIIQNLPQQPLFDLVGKTEIFELFPIISKAEMLVGGDSAPIHMSSLTNTKTFNISVGHVNFWETGPKADQSYIYRSESLEDLNLLKLGEIAAGLLSGQVHPELISRISRLESYSVPIPLKTDFGWELTSAIYFEKKFPMIHQAKLRQIIKKAYQINEGIIENLKYYSQSSKPQSLEIVSSFEVLLDKLSLLNADLDPFFHWLTGEKVAIGPMPLKKVLEQTELVHRNFSLLLKPYLLPEELKEYHGTV